MRQSLGHELASPADIGRRFHGVNGRNGPTVFGDQQARPGANAFQMAAQVRLEFTNPDCLHQHLNIK
jgi:hypothetical protein